MAATIREDVSTLGRDLTLTSWTGRWVHDRRQINNQLREMVRGIPGRGPRPWLMPERRQDLCHMETLPGKNG